MSPADVLEVILTSSIFTEISDSEAIPEILFEKILFSLPVLNTALFF